MSSKRKTENRAPGYDEYLAQFRMNSAIINTEGVLKGADLEAISNAHALKRSKTANEGWLQSLIVRREDPAKDDLADAGIIEKAEVALEKAWGPFQKQNAKRQGVQGKEPLRPCDLPPNDTQTKRLAIQQAWLDTVLEERDKLRERLKKWEEQEKEQTKQKQKEKAYLGEFGGFYWNDPELPRSIDGRTVVRDQNGVAVFEDDQSEKVADYLQECERRKRERAKNAREARKVIRQRDDLERNRVPRGVLQGKKSIHTWLQERGEQANA